jgi:hypothetical protein
MAAVATPTLAVRAASMSLNAEGAKLPDAGSSHAENDSQHLPGDHADAAGLTHSGGQGSARPVRDFRMSGADRVGNAVFSLLARAGVGPAHLLTTRGRKTGGPRTTPVTGSAGAAAVAIGDHVLLPVRAVTVVA